MRCRSAFLSSQHGSVIPNSNVHTQHSTRGITTTATNSYRSLVRTIVRSSNANGNEQNNENNDWDNSMAMAKYTLQRMAAAILSVPPDVFSLSPPMIATPPQSEEEALHRQAISEILSTGWSADTLPSDGFELLPGEETSFWKNDHDNDNNNEQDNDRKDCEKNARPGSSTYGEITELGARQLFTFMNLLKNDTTTKINNNGSVKFFDVGSGTGKLVLQAYMELPNLNKAVGIELAPSRHDIAVQVLNELYHSSQSLQTVRAMNPALLSQQQQQQQQQQQSHGDVSHDDAIIELHQGDLFEFDLGKATHMYISSLCFTRDMMERVADKIIHNNSAQHNLECLATLQVSTVLEEKFGRPRMEWVEMSWTTSRGQGCPVYFYDVK